MAGASTLRDRGEVTSKLISSGSATWNRILGRGGGGWSILYVYYVYYKLVLLSKEIV